MFNVGALLERFTALFKSYRPEFYQYNVYTLCLKLLGEALDKRIETWRGPMSSSSHDQLHDEHRIIGRLMKLLLDVFIYRKTESMLKYVKKMGVSEIKFQNTRISANDFRVLKRFTNYLVKNVMSRLRKFIVNEWVPEEEKDFSLLDFIQTWTHSIVTVETDDHDGEVKVPLKSIIKVAIISHKP